MRDSFSFCRSFGSLSLCWVGGYALGILSAAKACVCVVSWMRACCLSRVSIVLVLSWSLLPFLTAAYADRIQRPEIRSCCIFLRCFVCGYSLWLTVRAFGSAAWLAVPLYRFLDLASLVPFGWYVFQPTGSDRQSRTFRICLIAVIVVAVAYLLAVLPFGAMVADF